ncbi:MAG: tetratricopeptide repeat protein [Thermoflavifilum sp.]|nr:tetratricopeptide repeat protein [Thermoflavifilum sp.]
MGNIFRLNKGIILGALGICLLGIPLRALAQLNLNQILSNNQAALTPQQADSIYADKEVPAELLVNKKFTLPRKLYQNLVTHYNFVYNARRNLRMALQMAASLHHDDYTQLLSFYPYTPAEFSQVTGLLDSVIFRASVGIQVHDPRGKWIDNLYLLLGKAYYYEQKFAQAERAFQYINLRSAPAVKGEYHPVIGSLAEGSNHINIATPEKKGLFSHPSSRNEALIWLVKTYFSEGHVARAQSLLNLLMHDTQFPGRLRGQLFETAAWLYKQQQRYDQMIPYLRQAIALQPDKSLQARWTYLLGQIATLQHDSALAISAFDQCAQISHDPMMQFYATYQIALLSSNGAGKTPNPYQRLQEMIHKNRYERYRDILYHGMADIALKHADTATAIQYLLSSLHTVNMDNPSSEARSYSALLLSQILMSEKQFIQAAAYLDTALQLLPSNDPRKDSLTQQLQAVRVLAAHLQTINRQDSLQALAALPPEQRLQKVHAVWENIQQQMRVAEKNRERAARANILGLEGNPSGLQVNAPDINKPKNQQAAWYFNNPALKSAGYTTFLQIWGNRPLVDNWRRASAIQGFSAPAASQVDTASTNQVAQVDTSLSLGEQTLLHNIPLTAEQLKISNDSIQQALLAAAEILAFQLQRPSDARNMLNTLLQRFPQTQAYPRIAYLLFLINQELKDTNQANYYREVLLRNYPTSIYSQALQPAPTTHTNRISAWYDSAYQHYQQQQFNSAIVFIQQALAHEMNDTLLTQFQLLWAMSLYQLHAEDSSQHILERLALQYPNFPATALAKRVLDLMQHKQQLIARLESEPSVSDTTQSLVETPAQNPKNAQLPTVAAPKPIQRPDTAQARSAPVNPTPAPPPVASTPYTLHEKDPHFVIMVFSQPNAQILEASTQRFTTYLRGSQADSNILVGPYALTPTITMLIFRTFSNEDRALHFLDQIRAVAPALLQGLPTGSYEFYIISRSNFILLNQTKDLEGYVRFFNDNYITQ